MAITGLMDKFTWYYGLIVRGNPEFDDHQDAIEDAFQDLYLRFSGYGSLVHPDCYASAPADLFVHIGVGSVVAADGTVISWDAVQDIDITTSTHGTYIGNTGAGLGVGESRWVVIGAVHDYTDLQAAVDKNGNTVYYQQQATGAFQVWAGVNLTPGPDDWMADATLTALIALMRAANVEPVALGIRRNGDGGQVDDDHIFDVSRWCFEEGTHRTEHLDQRRCAAYSQFPVVRTDDGKVASAGVGTTNLTFAGGETIWIGWRSARFADILRQRSLALPATVLSTVGSGAGTWIARLRLDEEDGSAVLYFEATTNGYPRDTEMALDTYGPQGGALGGFPPTLVDMALCTFTTNAGDNILAIVDIANTAKSWVTHGVHASSIVCDAYGHVASTDVQSFLEELVDEKLARDGSQTMLGALDMNGNNIITGVGLVDGRDVSVDGALLDDHDVSVDNGVYPIRLIHQDYANDFHPMRYSTTLQNDWKGHRYWAQNLRDSVLNDTLAVTANKSYTLMGAEDATAVITRHNYTDTPALASDEIVLARFTATGAGITRYMDLASWSAPREVIGLDMHLANSVGAPELEITPGYFIKEGKIVPNYLTQTITLTPAGLANYTDTSLGVGPVVLAVGWYYVYGCSQEIYDVSGSGTATGHAYSMWPFLSLHPPDYTGGHPGWPFTQFLGAIYCSDNTGAAEQFRTMTKRKHFVVQQMAAITGMNPDNTVAYTVTLTAQVPLTAQEGYLDVKGVNTAGGALGLSYGPYATASLSANYPWQYSIGAGATFWSTNNRIPLVRGVSTPRIYMCSDAVAASGTMTVDMNVHGYWEDRNRPYYYEP